MGNYPALESLLYDIVLERLGESLDYFCKGCSVLEGCPLGGASCEDCDSEPICALYQIQEELVGQIVDTTINFLDGVLTELIKNIGPKEGKE